MGKDTVLRAVRTALTIFNLYRSNSDLCFNPDSLRKRFCAASKIFIFVTQIQPIGKTSYSIINSNGKHGMDHITCVINLLTFFIKALYFTNKKEMNKPSEQKTVLSILIVEDEKMLAMHEKSVLEDHGYRVTCIADNADAAIQSVEKDRPDIILMDITLSGITDGIDAAMIINEKFSIPVIFLSATESKSNISRINRTGSYGFLCKPIREYELLIAIESAYARYRIEKKSKFNEQKYRFIFENIQDVYFELSIDGSFIEVSPSIKNLAGYDRKEVIGKNIREFLSQPESAGSLIAETINQRGGLSHDVKLNRKDGGTVTCDTRTIIAFDKNDNPVKIVGSATDISSRKEMEEKVINARREIEALMLSLNSLLIGVSINDTITHWNREAERVFGIKSEIINGTKLTMSGFNWEWNRIYEGISLAISEDKACMLNEVRYSPAQDSERNRFLNIKITPVKDFDNKLMGFLLAGDDITEKRSMRIKANQSQKMEAIGQLAAGVAHEINTPTQYINDNTIFVSESLNQIIPVLKACMLLHEKEDNTKTIQEISSFVQKIDMPFLLEEMPKALTQSIEGIGKIAKIVGSMKQFSHPGTQEKIPYSINRIIDDTITISRNEWKYVSDVTTSLDTSVPDILCYPNELGQVFLNMIINAAQAIESKIGKNSEIKGLINISSQLRENNIIITVQDSGIGIPNNVKNKIFDPFYTTKPVGKGTGQGLSISHTVIYERHHGEISVESDPNTGTTFTIILPIYENTDQENENEI